MPGDIFEPGAEARVVWQANPLTRWREQADEFRRYAVVRHQQAEVGVEADQVAVEQPVRRGGQGEAGRRYRFTNPIAPTRPLLGEGSINLDELRRTFADWDL